mmetsp:Transcript_49196/g.110283  ORF Transcript_49196/g.110283 Transcript_49196/m.110283 type:complete len:88 (-) Transcript_49196:8-271(-)
MAEERKTIKVNGGRNFTVTQVMDVDDILESFAQSIGQSRRTEVAVMVNDNVQHRKLLAYDRLDPDTTYSVEVMAAPASSSQQAVGKQ